MDLAASAAASPPDASAAAAIGRLDAAGAAATADGTGAAEALLPDPALPLTPEQLAEQAAAEAAASREAQLERLLVKIQKNADFPSLRDSVRGIQTLTRSESVHMRTLTDEVLGDPALTTKLLRMINAAFYSSVGAGSITSLSRAIALMGFKPVGMLVASLTLFERLPKGPEGARVRHEFSRALMAAMLANQFCPIRRIEESAYITAMFQNLGTMLAWMHFPAEAQEAEALLQAEGQVGDHESLQRASRQVLGMSYDDMAQEVTRLWGWPESLQNDLRRLEPSDPERPATKEEYLRVVATAANRLACELEGCHSPEDQEACLAQFRARYGEPLGLDEVALAEMVERARAQWSDLAVVLGIRKLQPPPPKPVAAGKTGATTAAPSAAGAAQGTAERRDPARPPVTAIQVRSKAALTSALDTLSQRASSQAPLSEVLQLAMTQLHEALILQRVVICLRESGSGDLVGRLGVGERAQKVTPHFRVPMNPPADLFGLLCSKQADTLISDASEKTIAQRLPAWFRQHLRAPCFLLLPLTLDDKPIGMIYGDRADTHGLAVGPDELSLLKALRNQVVIAMRLRGAGG